MSSFRSNFERRLVAADHISSRIGWTTLVAWTWDLIRDAAKEVDPNEVREVVLAAYDKYVAPLNIPGVPDILEPRVDKIIRNQLSNAIDQLFLELNP
jgi:hypothetical protein